MVVHGRALLGLEGAYRVAEHLGEEPILEQRRPQMSDELPHLLQRAAERLVDTAEARAQLLGKDNPSASASLRSASRSCTSSRATDSCCVGAVVDVEADATEHALVALEDLRHRPLERLVEPHLLEEGADPLSNDPRGVPPQGIVLQWLGSRDPHHAERPFRRAHRQGQRVLEPGDAQGVGQAPAVEVDLHPFPVGLIGDPGRHGDVSSRRGC